MIYNRHVLWNYGGSGMTSDIIRLIFLASAALPNKNLTAVRDPRSGSPSIVQEVTEEYMWDYAEINKPFAQLPLFGFGIVIG